MTIEEFDKKLENEIKQLSDLGTTMVKIGQTALAQIKQRVIEEGKDAKGGNFPPYSTKPMLVGCKTFKKKNCNAFFGKEKNKDHRWATIKRGSEMYRLAYLEEGYKGLREMELSAEAGEKVNFFYQGTMWADISLVSNATDHSNGTVIIGAKRMEEKEKLYYNTERNKKKGGNEILDLSETEINELKELFNQPILNIFK